MPRDTRGGRMDTGDSQKAVSQEAISMQRHTIKAQNPESAMLQCLPLSALIVLTLQMQCTEATSS